MGFPGCVWQMLFTLMSVLLSFTSSSFLSLNTCVLSFLEVLPREFYQLWHFAWLSVDFLLKDRIWSGSRNWDLFLRLYTSLHIGHFSP